MTPSNSTSQHSNQNSSLSHACNIQENSQKNYIKGNNRFSTSNSIAKARSTSYHKIEHFEGNPQGPPSFSPSFVFVCACTCASFVLRFGAEEEEVWVLFAAAAVPPLLFPSPSPAPLAAAEPSDTPVAISIVKEVAVSNYYYLII